MKFFGKVTISRDNKRFGISCEPHVTMRLKRVFGKIDTGGFGLHELFASKENARDLAWFIERYPLEMDSAVRKILEGLRDEHIKTEKMIQKFNNGYKPKQAFELAIPARDYQKVAAAFLLVADAYLLADDAGLGKTVSFITALTDPKTLPALVVTLAHLPEQWEAEIKKFAPQLTTHVAKKATPYAFDTMPDVLIMNYHKLAGWAETLRDNIRSLCLDEPQELRHAGTNKYNAARFIQGGAKFCMGLSATPIYNYGGEAFHVINSIAPGSLGTWEEFNREWCVTEYGKSRLKDPKAFGTYLRSAGLMIRRTRQEVGRELPKVSKFYQPIHAATAALDAVSDSCAELARLILRGENLEKGRKMRAAEELSNTLRQATGIAKAPYVANFVKMLLEAGEKVVLYGWHRAVYAIWNDVLRDYKPVMYTGSESPRQKMYTKEMFVNGDSQLMFISLRAGAGMDGLQKVCRTVVFGELDWSPGVIEQCLWRIDRDGQPDPVMAYFLLAETGADPVMVDVLGLKRGQIEGIRNPEAPLFEKLQVDTNHVKKLAEAYLNQGAKTV